MQKEHMQQGLEIITQQFKVIAMLPVDEWLKALERAETMGAILDPTLYRSYIYSDQSKVVKPMLELACKVKAFMESVQPLAKKAMEEDYKKSPINKQLQKYHDELQEHIRADDDPTSVPKRLIKKVNNRG